MSQQKLVDIPFFDLSIENRKRLVFCIDFFNARVPEERKHKCEYIVKREWEKRDIRMWYRLLYGTISFLCFTWLLFTWGVIDNGKIKLIRMNDETVEASYEAGGTNEQYQEKPKIALTFDDGPNPSSTPVLLDGLAGRNVKVTFFVIGENVVKYPKVVSREAEEGHIIGNHTYSHVDLTKMSQEMTECELGKTNTAIEEITGKKTEYMRPPYGAWKKEMEENTGMIAVLWNVDPLDWNTDNETEIVNKVVTETEENDIILLHDCYLSSVKAALRIIDIMQAKGYEFVTVDELLLD